MSAAFWMFRSQAARRRLAAWATCGLSHLLQNAVELLRGEILVDALDRGEFARQPVQRRLVDLAFAVRLVGLAGIAVQVAHHFGN